MNRVSFLRTDHTFLSAALHHPTTSFLVFDKLNPLTKDPTNLAFASFKDVQPLIGEDPYSKAETDIIKEYNSSSYTPQLIFLGLDDRNAQGIVYKDVYKGAPYFAIDITPRHSIAAAAEELMSKLKIPVLVTHGRKDIVVLPSAAEKTAAAISGATLSWFNDCGHSPFQEDAPRFNRELAAFAKGAAGS